MVLCGAAVVRPGLMFVTATIASPRQILCSSRQQRQKYSYMFRFFLSKAEKHKMIRKIYNLALLFDQGNLGPWLTYAYYSSQCEGISQHCGRIGSFSSLRQFEKNIYL